MILLGLIEIVLQMVRMVIVHHINCEYEYYFEYNDNATYCSCGSSCTLSISRASGGHSTSSITCTIPLDTALSLLTILALFIPNACGDRSVYDTDIHEMPATVFIFI